MLPITLDVALLKVAVIGNGQAAFRRLQQLDQAKAPNVDVYADAPNAEIKRQAGDRLIERLPEQQEIESYHVLFVADLEDEKAETIVEVARKAGRLVNVEDVKKWCDFHVPSQVRRGDLTISVATAGKSPTIARKLREQLSELIGPEWEDYLEEMAAERLQWKEQGFSFAELKEKSEAFLEEKGWFD